MTYVALAFQDMCLLVAQDQSVLRVLASSACAVFDNTCPVLSNDVDKDTSATQVGCSWLAITDNPSLPILNGNRTLVKEAKNASKPQGRYVEPNLESKENSAVPREPSYPAVPSLYLGDSMEGAYLIQNIIAYGATHA